MYRNQVIKFGEQKTIYSTLLYLIHAQIHEKKEERAPLVKPSRRRDLVRSHIEEMTYNLPDIPYSIFNPRVPGATEEAHGKRLRQRKDTEEEKAVQAVEVCTSCQLKGS